MKEEIKALREKRYGLVQQAQALIHKEGGASEDELAQADKMLNETDDLKAKIERMERAEAAAVDMEARADERAVKGGISKDQAVDEDQKERKIFAKYLVGGARALDDAERAFMASRHAPIQGAQSAGTDSEGGYTVPEGFSAELDRAMLDYSGIRQTRAHVIRTETGADIPWPTVDDTGNPGQRIGENVQSTEAAMTFGVKTLKAYIYSSDHILVSRALMQDTGIDLEAFLIDALAERIGRITNTEFTTADGSSKPHGVMAAATVGKTAAATGALTVDELLDLKHSVDVAYRGQAEWMLNDATLLAIKKLEDSQNRPLWQAGLAAGSPDTIDGDPFVVNNDVATMAANALTVAYGDFSKFKVRDVAQRQIIRLNERFADYFQVAFLGFSRHDSQLINTAAIKTLKQAAA